MFKARRDAMVITTTGVMGRSATDTVGGKKAGSATSSTEVRMRLDAMCKGISDGQRSEIEQMQQIRDRLN